MKVDGGKGNRLRDRSRIEDRGWRMAEELRIKNGKVKKRCGGGGCRSALRQPYCLE
jgi:hypothetical protein